MPFRSFYCKRNTVHIHHLIKSRHPLALIILMTFAWGCPQFSGTNGADGASNAGANNSPSSNAKPGPAAERSCVTRVTFKDAPGANSVAIAGEFNEWDETQSVLERKDGLWFIDVELEPGEYAYKFVIDGEYEGEPPVEVPTKWSGEFENRSLIVADCAVPAWEVMSNEVSDAGEITAQLRFVPARGGASIDPESLRITLGDQEITPVLDVEQGLVTVTYQAPEFGKYSLRAWASDTQGRPTQENPLWLPMWHEQEEFVWQDATMYLIFTDRFLDTDGTMPQAPIQGVNAIAGYMGGDFKGIIDKIDEGYFNEMGINLLWLSPIYENTEESWGGGDGVNVFTGYHGYWPVDPLKAESRYGDAGNSADARLKELIDKAHARGIRVLFDVVHNHVHEDHVYCRENPAWCAVTCTCGGPGCAWEGPDGKPLTCQFAPYLPDLNYRNHAILQRQVKDTMTLAQMFDVDGLRVDAAKHMDHVIMRRLRQELNDLEARGASPFYAVGETFTGGEGYGLIMNYVSDHELHGQFDFPLLYPIRDTFGKEGSFKNLEAAVIRSEQAYGDAYQWMSPFLGNHDIPRFVTESLGNDWDPWNSSLDVMAQGPQDTIADEQWNLINRLSLGFAFLLTQPGIPLVYYGDEVGLAGSADPDNRRMMDWEWNAGQRELLERVRAIGRARQDLEPLRRGTRKELYVDDTLYVYARTQGPGQTVIIAMNKGGTRQEAVTIPAELGLDGVQLRSVVSERTMTVNGQTLDLSIDPWEYLILSP
jgi:glycosidase